MRHRKHALAGHMRPDMAGGRAAEGETLDDADTTMPTRPMVMGLLLRGHELLLVFLGPMERKVRNLDIFDTCQK